VLRDFKGQNEQGGHPDFERSVCGLTTGMVQNSLDADGKPVYSGGGCVQSQQTFSQWYRDVGGVNQTVVQTLTLQQRTDLDPSGRTYRFSDNDWFPLTGQAFGNTPGWSRNFHFTSEFRSYFEYRGGETLEFTGDDDVWVFINGRLAVDIGGIHSAANGSVTLSNSTDPQTGQVFDSRFDIFAGGVYEIVVFQAERHTTQSNYRLTLSGFLNTGESVCESICGDGIISGIEQCDDGNANDGDGCSSGCAVEPGYNCTGTPSVCEQPTCGDGMVVAPEECDDGGTDDGDGCSSTCKLESCGDGMVDPLEGCDDGNDVATDACTTRCQPAVCGDGFVQSGVEECDDGNSVDTDACTNSCTVAECGDGIVGPGERCDDGVNDGSYGSCTPDCQSSAPSCGDGIVSTVNGEQCDDGINDGTYGTCESDCTLAPYCGDGVRNASAGEECDDGDTDYGDGCDGQCKVEPGYVCQENANGLSTCSFGG
jgi:fibro-slime domain-containing protein